MSPTTRPTLLGSFGMVSTTHWLAASSAMRMLELGGNAADAACAGAFVLQVVEPHLNGPGGDVPMLVGTADGDVQVLCGQGSAPAGATIEHYRGLGLSLVPGAGLLAAVVPGAMDAWLRLLAERGSLPLREVLEPAIGYAENGHAITPGAVRSIAAVERLYREHWTTSAAQWLPHGRLPAPGDIVTNKPWAATLQRIVAEAEAAGSDRDRQIEAARTAWAEGFVAAGVDAFARIPARDSSGNDHAGVHHRRGPRPVALVVGGPGDRRLPRLPGRQDAGLVAGPGAAPDPPAAVRARRPRRAGSLVGRRDPCAGRGGQARLRRSRGLVRRQRRGAVGGAARPGVRG